jgi:hypothetical protein
MIVLDVHAEGGPRETRQKGGGKVAPGEALENSDY